MATADRNVAPPRTRPWLLPGVILAAGLVLRLLEYLRKDSLWGDEAMLALNVATRSFHELTRPLDLAQIASVPFLWAERLMISLFGVNEWALRAAPLIAGCVLCFAVIVVARRILAPDEALVALVLVAFSQMLIRYTAEFKPYGLDALLAVCLVGAAAGLIGRMHHGRSWGVLAAAGTIAVLCSLASVFVCLGVIVALAVHALRSNRANLLPRIGLMGLAWAIPFAVGYAELYQRESNAPYMRAFWEGAFIAPGSPYFSARLSIASAELSRAIYPGMALLGLGMVTVLLLLLGGIALWRRNQAPHALLLLVPGLAPIVASTFGLYPIAARLMLFSAPLFLMVAAVGIMVVGRAVHARIGRVPTRWVTALLVLPAVITSLAYAMQERDEQMRPLVQLLDQRWGQGDPVYVYHRVVPAWLFYSTNWAAPNLRQLAWAMTVSGPGGLGHENGPTRGPRPAGEGRGLAYELEDHKVLLGASSGVQARPLFGYRPRRPDKGWAFNEIQRMRAAANPRIWMILGNASHAGLDLERDLALEVIDQGGRVLSQDFIQDGALYQLEFPSGAP